MKSAIMEFMNAHGGTPEAAIVMPEVVGSSSQLFSPRERDELVQLAGRRPQFTDLQAKLGTLSPKPSLPLTGERPSLSLSFQPHPPRDSPRLGAIEPVMPSADRAYLRDMPIRVRDRLEASLGRPQLSAKGPPAASAKHGMQPLHFDPSRSPDTFAMGAQKGENLVRSLIQQVRSHGRSEAYHMSPAPADVKTARRKAKAPKTKKKARPRQKPRKVSPRKPSKKRRRRK
jgi:hypothetical protein